MTELDKKVSRFFPYENVSPFQDEFIETIFNSGKESTSVVIEGTNGLGKTIGALCACLPIALEKNLKILYVARTHRQHERVIEEMRSVSKKRSVSGVSVRGRHDLCLNHLAKKNGKEFKVFMDVCELLKSKKRCPYYSNIENKGREYFETRTRFILKPHTASEILEVCRFKGFCPYELVKASLPNVNVVALSYLYIFDPAIRAHFLKSLRLPLRKTILIIDEAHNLPETAIEVASTALTLFSLKQAEAEAKDFKHAEIAAFVKIFRDEVELTAEKIQ